MISLRKTFILLAIFSIAMGFMESAVVIYLRELYYPGGFKFPLVAIPPHIGLVEIIREAATIIMLVVIGGLAGKNSVQRFCFFLFCFAVWDIFYYVFLKIFLDWPESVLTPDILFLIPVPWVGPVIAPCIASLTMIAITLLVSHYHGKNIFVTINRQEWSLLIAGSVVMLASFMQDYILYVNRRHTAAWSLPGGGELFGEFANYVPQGFNWVLFLTGELLMLTAIFLMRKRFAAARAKAQ